MNETLTGVNPIVLTARDIAGMLQISLSAVYQHASDGTLPAFKIKGNVRFLRSAVIQKIEDLAKSAYGGNR